MLQTVRGKSQLCFERVLSHPNEAKRGRQGRQGREFVFYLKFTKVKRKSTTTSHLSRGNLPLKDIYAVIVCVHVLSAYGWPFHFLSSTIFTRFYETLYNINQNGSKKQPTLPGLPKTKTNKQTNLCNE